VFAHEAAAGAGRPCLDDSLHLDRNDVRGGALLGELTVRMRARKRVQM
jgi:hypothetical protein